MANEDFFLCVCIKPPAKKVFFSFSFFLSRFNMVQKKPSLIKYTKELRFFAVDTQ